MDAKKKERLQNKITQEYVKDMSRMMDLKEEDGYFVTSVTNDGTMCTAMAGKIETVMKLMAIAIVKMANEAAPEEAEKDKIIAEICDAIWNVYAAMKGES